MIILVLVLLGLCFGSFTNALVWRLHEQSRPKSRRPKHINLSILRGRSACPNCQHQLAATDLVPVLSWLALRGKCRYCHKPISTQYPLVELLMVLLFVLSYLLWPYGWAVLGVARFVAWLVILVLFVALAIYDLRWMLLPNKLVWPLVGLTALQVVVLTIHQADIAVLVGYLWGVVFLAGLFGAMYWLSRGAWIGFGDVKMAVGLGLLVGGPLSAILLLFISSVVGLLFSVPLMARGKDSLKLKIPYGPFLIIATIIVYLVGASLTSWYKRQFLLL